MSGVSIHCPFLSKNTIVSLVYAYIYKLYMCVLIMSVYLSRSWWHDVALSACMFVCMPLVVMFFEMLSPKAPLALCDRWAHKTTLKRSETNAVFGTYTNNVMIYYFLSILGGFLILNVKEVQSNKFKYCRKRV